MVNPQELSGRLFVSGLYSFGALCGCALPIVGFFTAKGKTSKMLIAENATQDEVDSLFDSEATVIAVRSHVMSSTDDLRLKM